MISLRPIHVAIKINGARGLVSGTLADPSEGLGTYPRLPEDTAYRGLQLVVHRKARAVTLKRLAK